MSRVDPSGRVGDAITKAPEHPDTDALMAFAEAPATRSQADEVARHLETCTTCRSLVEDLRNYPALDPPTDSFRVDENEIRASLAALRMRHLELQVQADTRPEAQHDGDPVASLPPVAKTPPRTALWNRPSAWMTWAATLVLALGWVLHAERASRRLNREVASLTGRLATAEAELRTPQANVRIVQLHPAGDPLRSATATTISLKQSDTVVVFSRDEPWPDGSYTGEIRDRNGKVIQPIEPILPQVIGLTILLRRGSLTPGVYEVRFIHDATRNEMPPFELLVDQ